MSGLRSAPSNPFDDLDNAMPLENQSLSTYQPPGWWDRFWIHFEDQQRNGTILGATEQAAGLLKESGADFQRRYELFPQYDGPLELSSAVLGSLFGGALAPENYVPVAAGAKLATVAGISLTHLWGRIFAGAVDAAAVNAVVDPAIQGIQIAGGTRHGFDPLQAAGSIAIGAVAGGALGGILGRREGAPAAREETPPGVEPVPTAVRVEPDGLPVVERLPAATSERPALDPLAPGEVTKPSPEDAAALRAAAAAEPAAEPGAAPPRAAETAKPGGPEDHPAAVARAAGEEPALGDALSEQARARMYPGDEAPLPKRPTPAASAREGPGAGDEPLARSVGTPKGAPQRAAAGTAQPAAAAAATPPAFGRLRDVANALADLTEVDATRQARLTAKVKGGTVTGQFAPKTGVIRVRSQDDFDTFTHEVGHHIELEIGAPLQAAMQQHKAELVPLAYAGARKGTELKEGFAEFFRLHLTNPVYAQKQAPKFDAAFRVLVKAHSPELDAGIAEVTRAYGAWVKQPSQAAVASTIVSAKAPGWIGKLGQEVRRFGLGRTIADRFNAAYAFLLDDLHPIQRAVRALAAIHNENTGKRLDLPTTRDPYKLARLSRGAYSSGHMDVVYGVHAYGDVKPSSPSLRDAIIEAMGGRNSLSKWDDDLAKSFGSYLWSRRAVGEWDRFNQGLIPNPPDKLTLGDHTTNVAELEKAHPQFVTAAQKVHAWAEALWQKKRDAGLITSTQHAAGAAIKDYVPGLRAFDYDGDPLKQAGQRGGSAKAGLVKRFRGSRRDVINPLESLMSDAYETAMAISRNDVVKQLDRLAALAGRGGGAIAERIPSHEIRATEIDPLEVVEKAARQAGMSMPDAIALRDAFETAVGPDKVAIFRPAIINEKGEPIAFFRDGGELRALRLADGAFGQQMYRALTMMSRSEKNFFINLLSMPAAALRTGITTAPEFLLANFVRDQAMAFLFYGKPLTRLRRTFGGMADEIFGRDTARAYNQAGGIMGGAQTAALRDAAVERDLGALRRKGWRAQRAVSLKGFFEMTELSETGGRLGLFKSFYQEGRKRGLSELEATASAAWGARDFIDFDRRGWGMAAVARLVPFLNASLQGLDKGARQMIVPFAQKALTGEEAGAMGDAVKAWARLGMLTVAGISLHALNSRRPDYDEVSTTTRATSWMVPWGDRWIAIPKPFEGAAVLNLGEAAFDALVKHDPTAGKRWLEGLYQVIAPPSLATGNPTVANYFELKTNTDFFTGSKIVPDELQGLEPYLQFTASTSALSKWLGRAIDVSPMVIDHLITANLGSWGRDALSLFDMAAADRPAPGWDDMPIVRRFIKDAAKGATSTRAFWDLVSDGSGRMMSAAKSWRAMMDAGDVTRAADYLAAMDDELRAYVTAQAMPAEDARMHPLDRAHSAIQTLSKLRTDLLSDHLENALGEHVKVTRLEARTADDILATWAMAEARNALVAIGEPGWKGRAPIPQEGFVRELQALSPDLLGVLADRFASARVLPEATVLQQWPELRKRLLADGSSALVIDLRATAGAEGYELGGLKLRRPNKPAVPGKD